MNQVVKYRNRLIMLVILPASIVSLVGCTGAPSTPPPAQTLLSVPQKADLIVEIELAKIIDDEDFAELYQYAAQDTTLPQTLDAALEKVEHETGINLRDFDTAVVFGEAATFIESAESSPGSHQYWGALVEGKLNENTFISNIEGKIGKELPGSSYQNYTIYVLPNLEGQGAAFSIAFPTEEQMVIGTTLAVKDVIDVKVGRQEPMSGAVYDLYSQLDDALIKLASTVPKTLLERIPAEIPIGPLTLSLLCFRDIECTTLTLTKSDAIINAQACFVFTNEDSASDSRKLLWTGTKVGKYAVSDANIKTLLSKIDISQRGSSVSLMLAMTISEIEQLISATSQEAK